MKFIVIDSTVQLQYINKTAFDEWASGCCNVVCRQLLCSQSYREVMAQLHKQKYIAYNQHFLYTIVIKQNK